MAYNDRVSRACAPGPALQAKHPSLLWVNNLVDSMQPALIRKSNGRMYEGGDGVGLDNVYSGHVAVGQRIAISRQWAVQGAQPQRAAALRASRFVGARAVWP